MCVILYIFQIPRGVNAPLNETLTVTCVYMASPPPQVAGEDEGVQEKAIEYVTTSLIRMRHILFIPQVKMRSTFSLTSRR